MQKTIKGGIPKQELPPISSWGSSLIQFFKHHHPFRLRAFAEPPADIPGRYILDAPRAERRLMQQWDFRPMVDSNVFITARRMRRNHHDEDFRRLLFHVQDKHGTNLSFVRPIFIRKISKPNVTRSQQLQQQVFVQL